MPCRLPAPAPSTRRPLRVRATGRLVQATAVAAGLLGMPAMASPPAPPTTAKGALSPCRIAGVATEVRCGIVRRPLDPAAASRGDATPLIDVHYAVLPALSRVRKPDPVFLLAGGPGQSAIDLAGLAQGLLGRLNARRDVVLVDQRGTGRSAPLLCPSRPATASLAEGLDRRLQLERLQACQADLARQPHGDLRHYATWVAMQDVDAVRAALGAEQVNLVGGSYGTRAGLEYLRQYPGRVRRAVLDGLAPPDMVLPEAFARDLQAALETVFEACASDARCAQRHPDLRRQWQALLQAPARRVALVHPVTGRPETVTLDAPSLVTLVRGPLYQPALAAGLPQAIADASAGRFDGLLGLGLGLASGSPRRPMAEGLHFSVICAEDAPRLGNADDAAGDPQGASARQVLTGLYRDVCAHWPQGPVPAGFYQVPASPAPVLLLSGGADPVTPPRHGQRMAEALGPKARHGVVEHAGHGVLALPCLRDVVFRFIDAPDEGAAMAVNVDCAREVPRPPVFLWPASEAGTGTRP